MSTSMKTVVTFSNDIDFVRMVDNSKFSAISSTDRALGYSFRSTSSDVAGLSDYDVVIYDVDMANENVLCAKEDILHLKLNSRSKPLVIVGQKSFMRTLMSTGNIAHLVSRNIAKPAMSSHLTMAINAAINDQVGNRSASNAPKSDDAASAFGPRCIAAIGSVFGINRVHQL